MPIRYTGSRICYYGEDMLEGQDHGPKSHQCISQGAPSENKQKRYDIVRRIKSILDKVLLLMYAYIHI